jgi:hypothetical protein
MTVLAHKTRATVSCESAGAGGLRYGRVSQTVDVKAQPALTPHPQYLASFAIRD